MPSLGDVIALAALLAALAGWLAARARPPMPRALDGAPAAVPAHVPAPPADRSGVGPAPPQAPPRRGPAPAATGAGRGTLPDFGGPRWAANAVVAAEVFGPPIALRPGGTLGPPRAF